MVFCSFRVSLCIRASRFYMKSLTCTIVCVCTLDIVHILYIVHCIVYIIQCMEYDLINQNICMDACHIQFILQVHCTSYVYVVHRTTYYVLCSLYHVLCDFVQCTHDRARYISNDTQSTTFVYASQIMERVISTICMVYMYTWCHVLFTAYGIYTVSCDL